MLRNGPASIVELLAIREDLLTSVKEVSNGVIRASSQPISNHKLQKLLYYVQGWKLEFYGEPAFYEQIEAWVHGPVVPAAFKEYRHFGWNTIEAPCEEVNLSSDEVEHIEKVLSVYGSLTATQLENLSHEEDPWLTARGSLDAKSVSRTTITNDSMKAYFRKRMDG